MFPIHFLTAFILSIRREKVFIRRQHVHFALTDNIIFDENESFKQIETIQKSYFCYFIKSNNLTYNGYTVDLSRRLRQHNEIIKGNYFITFLITTNCPFFSSLLSIILKQ